jgi:hypothetical protein
MLTENRNFGADRAAIKRFSPHQKDACGAAQGAPLAWPPGLTA